MAQETVHTPADTDSETGTEIVATEDTVSGYHRLKDTRIRVIDVVQAYAEMEWTIERIADEYSITPQQVLSALRFYYDHPDTVREELREERQAA